MAVYDVAKRASLGLVLNAGTNDAGNTIKKSMTVSGLKIGADKDKAHTAATLIAACLMYPVIEVTRTEVVTLEQE
ncbi:MAG: hypothetical protein IJW90_00405 [Clostridia bacterium]|nr:hypothetical protein [Clostridia bacterium]